MSASRPPIVAIDGPAGSGKSTVAKRLAERAGLQFISSGAMYRAVALRALREGVLAADRDRLVALASELNTAFLTDGGSARVLLDGADVTEALQDSRVGRVASAIATIPELREHLVAKQREYGRLGGVVMEGRDIQTVVFPDADIKVFLTASLEERARRRWKELKDCGAQVGYIHVLDEVRLRDTQDAEREASPLRAASDATMVDTEGRGVEQVVDILVRIIETWRAHSGLRGSELARAAGIQEPGGPGKDRGIR